MKVPTADLRRATEILLLHLEQSGHTDIDLDKDYYWSIPPEQRHDPYTQPEELGLGRLSEDWEQILAIVRGEKDPVAYALVWLSSILRTVGEQVVQ